MLELGLYISELILFFSMFFNIVSLSIAKAFVDMECKNHQEKLKHDKEKRSVCWCCGAPPVIDQNSLQKEVDAFVNKDQTMDLKFEDITLKTALKPKVPNVLPKVTCTDTSES